MKLARVMKSPGSRNDEMLEAEYVQLTKIVNELSGKTLPVHITLQINDELARVNYFTGSKKELLRQIRRSQARILRLLEKKLNLVPRNYYRNTWSFIGISFFGIPAVLAGFIIGNLELMAAGMPLGICVGMAIGHLMDKRAVQNGYQLNV